jgi:hypothetical protein
MICGLNNGAGVFPMPVTALDYRLCPAHRRSSANGFTDR